MAMPTPLKEAVSRQLDEYCRNKIPPEVSHQLRLGYEMRGSSYTLFEERPAFDDPATWVQLPIARFRYNLTRGLWTLYWADSHTRWHRYDLIGPAKTLGPLIEEVDRDPTHIFWG